MSFGKNLARLVPTVLAAAAVGCAGYQIGNHTLYRPDIHNVYVPMFESDSLRRRLGEELTEAVAKEIEAKTPYKLVDTADADSTLSGHIVAENKRMVAQTINGQPREVETLFYVQVSWVNRRGQLLGAPRNVPLSPALLDVTQTARQVPEAGQSLATAHQETIQRLAEQIVAQMESPW